MGHAKMGPSKADRWMTCTGSVAACEGIPDRPTRYALEGTAAHTLAAWVLESEDDCAAYIGRVIEVPRKEAPDAPEAWLRWEVTREMAEFVQVYVDAIRRLASVEGAQLFVELPVDVSHLTGERVLAEDENGNPVPVINPDGTPALDADGNPVYATEGASGTADAVVIYDEARESASPHDGDNVVLTVLHVNDLKFGRGVLVEAERNRQMLMYASGTLEAIRMMDMPDPDLIRVSVHQPRAGGSSTWECSMRELEDFKAECRVKAVLAKAPDAAEHLTASEKACRFCPRKSVCEVARKFAEEQMAMDFDDLGTEEGQATASMAIVHADGDTLSRLLAIEDFVVDLFKKARARAEAILLGGGVIPDWKVVRGRKGARRWKDPAAAEAALKAIRLKVEQMYEMKVISPTEAERLKKDGAIGPRQWPKVQELITQDEGKLSIAPVGDKREAIVVDPSADYDAVIDNGGLDDLAD